MKFERLPSKNMLKTYFTLTLWLAILSFLPGTNCLADKNNIHTISEDLFVPNIPIFNEEGEKLFLDKYEGKTVLLVFWATWCGSCTEELPILDILQKDFRKLPFEVIAVSQDMQGIPVIRKFFDENDIRHLAIFHDYRNQLFHEMEVAGIPTAFLINPDGKIKLVFKGLVKWQSEDIRELVLDHIPGNPEHPKNSYKQEMLKVKTKHKAGAQNEQGKNAQ